MFLFMMKSALSDRSTYRILLGETYSGHITTNVEIEMGRPEDGNNSP